MRIIIIGLDNAGKTTILCKIDEAYLNFVILQIAYIQMRSYQQYQVSYYLLPLMIDVLAVGFNVETVTYKNLKFQVWDLGGQTGLRPYWRCYYQDTNAVIFVVDSADKERIEIAKQELELMLQEEELKGVPVLVLANK